jgi:hypothetical protein
VPQGRKPVFELTTRLGLRIRATANHPFRQWSGWTALADLRPGDRIAAARQVPVFGSTPLPAWEAALLGLMISEGQCQTPGHSPVFTNEDPVLVELLRACVAEGELGTTTSNGNLGYRLVNHAGRGGVPEKNRASRWLARHGADVKSAAKAVPAAVFTAPAEAVATFLRALFSGDGTIYGDDEAMFLEYTSMSRRLVEDVRHLLLRFGVVSRLRWKETALGTVAHTLQVTDRDTVLRWGERIGFWPGSEKQVRLETQFLPGLRLRGSQRSNFDTLPPDAWARVDAALTAAGRTAKEAGLPCRSSPQSLPRAFAARAGAATADAELAELADVGPVWDVVESIVPAGEEEVFDLSVPGAENFLANDLMVHNSTYARCGIIVNVTPLEPSGGRRHDRDQQHDAVAREDLRQRGIAQILLLRARQDSARRRTGPQGKYQNQSGLTLLESRRRSQPRSALGPVRPALPRAVGRASVPGRLQAPPGVAMMGACASAGVPRRLALALGCGRRPQGGARRLRRDRRPPSSAAPADLRLGVRPRLRPGTLGRARRQGPLDLGARPVSGTSSTCSSGSCVEAGAPRWRPTWIGGIPSSATRASG